MMAATVVPQWVPLARVFPAALDTETDPSRLADGLSPDAYGQGLLHPGYLYQAQIPTGTSPVKQTAIIGGKTFTRYFRRLWRVSEGGDTNLVSLIYNAPEYVDIYLRQGLGALAFDEDDNALVTFFPFENDSMFVAKATGGYRVPNAVSHTGSFQHDNIVECMKVTTAANAIELDDVAYVSNDKGVFAWYGYNVAELTALCRTKAATFGDKALTRDEQKRWLIGTNFVYEPIKRMSGRLYDFSTTGFRYTSRTLTSGDGAPFIVKQLRFWFVNTLESSDDIVMQIRLDDGAWSNDITVPVRWADNQREQSIVGMEPPLQGREFTMRITTIPDGLRIRMIEVLTEGFQEKESWSQ